MIADLQKESVQQFIRENEQEDAFQLSLRYSEVDGVPIQLVAEQIASRQKAKQKLPSWYDTKGILYPQKLSMEQCSSETTAKYKASLVNGKHFVDLTGGAGVDAWALSSSFETGDYVEQNSLLAELTKVNFEKLGIEDLSITNGSAEEFLQKIHDSVDLIYIDPARRDQHKNRVFQLSDCIPDIIELLPILKSKAKQVLIKTSPMMDIDLSLKSMKGVSEVYILSVDNDCKEVLYLVEEVEVKELLIKTVNFKKGDKEQFDFSQREASTAQACYSLPKKYLYEPNASIMKSGAFELISQRFSLSKLHPNTQLYTSNELVESFPGRRFIIEANIGYDKKELKKLIPDQKANVATRNFKDNVDKIRKKTGLKDGGDYFVFACTNLDNNPTILITKKVSPVL